MPRLFSSDKTFRPRRGFMNGSKRDTLQSYIVQTLGSGDLSAAVKLPPGENLNEWWAVNVVDFFNQVNLLYGSVAEFCTNASCPVMNAGPKYEYLWADGVRVKKPLKVIDGMRFRCLDECSAPEYVDYLMTWIQDQLDDEKIFPSNIEVEFPPDFSQVISSIFRKLFRVYGHIYHAHLTTVEGLGEEAHLNSSFKHFLYFVREFNLVDKKEMAPLKELIEHFDNRNQSS